MISAKKKNFIVEYRPSAIRAARISSETAPTVVEEVVEIDLSKDDSPASKIRDFAKVKSNAYMHAFSAIYPEGRLVRQVLLDAQRGKEVEYVFDFLRKSGGVNPDTFAAYCLSAADGSEIDPAANNKKEILVCGASKEEISDAQNALIESGIYPRRLELGTLGTLGSLIDAVGSDASRSPVLFLEIDQQFTNAVIVGPKGVEMARRIDCGANHIALALKEEMNLKDEAAAEKILQSRDFDLGPIAPKLLRKLLRELQSSIGFFEVQTGSSVSELYCLKDGRFLPWLEGSICDLLNLTPLPLNLGRWLEGKGVTFASDDIAKQIDNTWISLFSLALEFGKGGQS
ncbi:hypothetical protein [Pelagicoccus sp. SDUM812002]|uniref:hypothetical protein n=1 Tax=Pelagicoccus sp. SDUM812002 TaxID=3041266 RepID=UPI00280C4231|nr:hypothetical protein [Pelagicoccus sp. SDUM812002]MDQ8186104.1 hypothetical protein [Pelagicoccus sp. SDUM812002]